MKVPITTETKLQRFGRTYLHSDNEIVGAKRVFGLPLLGLFGTVFLTTLAAVMLMYLWVMFL